MRGVLATRNCYLHHDKTFFELECVTTIIIVSSLFDRILASRILKNFGTKQRFRMFSVKAVHVKLSFHSQEIHVTFLRVLPAWTWYVVCVEEVVVAVRRRTITPLPTRQIERRRSCRRGSTTNNNAFAN